MDMLTHPFFWVGVLCGIALSMVVAASFYWSFTAHERTYEARGRAQMGEE